tara:strand:+ start:15413 stop:15811 length:399 start_codon:yes stop_codon:yes gene_type:complete
MANSYNSNKAMKKSAKLSLPERKYCSCVMKVRGNHFKKTVKNVKRAKKNDLLNPYAICNKSVLKNKKYAGIKGKRISCSINYNFKKYPTEYLQAYSLEHKLPIVGKNGKVYARSTLLRNIQSKLKKKYKKLN